MEIIIICVLIVCVAISNIYFSVKIRNLNSKIEHQHIVISEDDGVFFSIAKKLREIACDNYIEGKPFLVNDIMLEAQKRGYFKKDAIINGKYTYRSLSSISDNDIVFRCKYNISRHLCGWCDVVVYKDGLWADISFGDIPKSDIVEMANAYAAKSNK